MTQKRGGPAIGREDPELSERALRRTPRRARMPVDRRLWPFAIGHLFLLLTAAMVDRNGLPDWVSLFLYLLWIATGFALFVRVSDVLQDYAGSLAAAISSSGLGICTFLIGKDSLTGLLLGEVWIIETGCLWVLFVSIMVKFNGELRKKLRHAGWFILCCGILVILGRAFS